MVGAMTLQIWLGWLAVGGVVVMLVGMVVLAAQGQRGKWGVGRRFEGLVGEAHPTCPHSGPYVLHPGPGFGVCNGDAAEG